MNTLEQNEEQVISIIIVLGLKLREKQKNQYEMDNFLYDRLELANKLFQSIQFQEKTLLKSQNTPSCILLSGRGQVGIESHVMRDYLKNTYKYLDENLLVEDNSMTTVENFILSFYQIWKKYEKVEKGKQLNILIVTSDYHKDRSKHICESFAPYFKQAFINNKINKIEYYGSITHTSENQYLWNLSQDQINQFLQPIFQWSEFAKYRHLSPQDQQLFLEYSNLVLKK